MSAKSIILIAILGAMVVGCQGGAETFDENYDTKIKMTAEQKAAMEAEAKNQPVPGQATPGQPTSQGPGTMPLPKGKSGR